MCAFSLPLSASSLSLWVTDLNYKRQKIAFMCEYCSDMHICWGSLARQQSFRKRAQRSVVFWLRVSHIGLWCQASSIYTTYVYICMFILSGFAIKSLSYLPELWCHFVIACDPLVIHKKSHKTIYYDSWSAKYIKIERLADTSCTVCNWVNKFPSSAQHFHFWLEHFIVIPMKKKRKQFPILCVEGETST